MVITGQRHEHHPANAARGCLCGCHWVEGCTGTRVEDSDTPKLATLGMLYAEFDTEHHGRVLVAYSYAELGLEALAKSAS
jgi:hypothetical protein